MRAEPIRTKLHFELLDPVLHIPTKHVEPIIETLRLEVLDVGDHKTLIGTFLQVLHFGDDPASALPALSPIRKRCETAMLYPSFQEGCLCLGCNRLHSRPEPLVGDHPYYIVNPLPLTQLIELRHRKASIRPHNNVRLAIRPLEHPNDRF